MKSISDYLITDSKSISTKISIIKIQVGGILMNTDFNIISETHNDTLMIKINNYISNITGDIIMREISKILGGGIK